jgi:phosphoglycerate dehydrogenase-like enzyme
MKVLFLNRLPSPLQPWYDDFVAALGGRFPVELYDPARSLADQYRGVGVAIDHGGFGADRTYLEAAWQAGVKLWQALSNGVDYVDVGYLSEKGLPLANTPGPFSGIALAEHALFLMLALAKNYHGSQRHVRSKVFYTPANDELEGKTLSVIGLGASGRELARRAAAMGMRVLAIDVVEIPPAVRQECHVDFFANLDQLDRVLAESDYLSLHIPLTKATRHLIDRRALARMKPTAVLINVSRGPIVDEAALLEALQAGRLKGAGLDVFEREPLDPEHPLLRLENVIATQHVAGTTTGTSKRRAQACAENVARIAQGLPALYQIPLG